MQSQIVVFEKRPPRAAVTLREESITAEGRSGGSTTVWFEGGLVFQRGERNLLKGIQRQK